MYLCWLLFCPFCYKYGCFLYVSFYIILGFQLLLVKDVAFHSRLIGIKLYAINQTVKAVFTFHLMWY